MVLESVSCTEEDLLFTDAETGQLEPLHCAYIFSTTMPMCVQSCGTLKALSEAPCCQLRISIYQHIDIDIDISAHNTVPPHQGCHDVFKIWYKDKWYNDVHQGPFPSLPCTDTFIFISML